jgi:hypothetical protein
MAVRGLGGGESPGAIAGAGAGAAVWERSAISSEHRASRYCAWLCLSLAADLRRERDGALKVFDAGLGPRP